MSDQQSGNLPADAEDPGYKQLGDDGNPFTDGDAAEQQGTHTEQPDVNPSSDDEEDRAAHYA